MATNRLDAVLLADAGGLLSGIVTGKVCVPLPPIKFSCQAFVCLVGLCLELKRFILSGLKRNDIIIVDPLNCIPLGSLKLASVSIKCPGVMDFLTLGAMCHCNFCS
jgi:hypothetical protein